MFVLTEMKDTVRIPPWRFDKDINVAVTEALNKKLANKVVHNLGLCISLWDIQKLEDSYIFPGDGSHHTVVHFRYVVFRPFVDEILLGKIKSCSKEGVYVTMGFFDDIMIPSDALQHPTRFDENEQLWAWEYELEDGKHDLYMDIGEDISDENEQLWAWEYELEDGKHDLYMDIGEDIRFRVVDEIFVDTSPTGPDHNNQDKPPDITEPETKKSPYSITASISEPGLGLLSWWNS